MVFNSFSFAIFFPIVFAVYWLLSARLQNVWLLAASYFFYGSWDWRFLSLIVLSTVVDFIVGGKIHSNNQGSNRKAARNWLLLSLAVNLGLLAVFKYYDFFIGSFVELLSVFGMSANVPLLQIILPVGISFYTFQTLSYSIDIYRKKLTPIDSALTFAVFVSYFPQLVAGPIERASALLPQIAERRQLSLGFAFSGIRLIAVGLFKKVFVADNLAPYVDTVFSAGSYTTAEVMLAGLLFAFQIYADFSGYTDIARGLSRLLGIELRLNFNFPYISQSPQEFWRRWHISLSSWLRDYLYIPLGGNKNGPVQTYRNLALTMLLGGLWHGAAWNFVVWGAYQGGILAVHRYLSRNVFRRNKSVADDEDKWTLGRVLRIAVFFQFVCYGWILFRAESLSQIVSMTAALFSFDFSYERPLLIAFVQFAGPLILLEAVFLRFLRKWQPFTIGRYVTHGAIYGLLVYAIVFLGGSSDSFIYFQF